MTENTAFIDLLAAQKEMPTLQKSAINPHFKNRYVPLEELLQTVLPILNKHNFVFMQMPCSLGLAEPALEYCLIHVSGERFGGTMLLQAQKAGPQDQGSAITYARRYSLMSLLGLSADVDDDAETAHKPVQNGYAQAPRPGIVKPMPQAPTRPQTQAAQMRAPLCPTHKQEANLRPAGVSKAGKSYPSFYSCPERSCNWTINIAEWHDILERQEQLAQPSQPMLEPDAVPFE